MFMWNEGNFRVSRRYRDNLFKVLILRLGNWGLKRLFVYWLMRLFNKYLFYSRVGISIYIFLF